MKTIKYALVAIFTITLLLSCGDDKKKEKGDDQKIKINTSNDTKKNVDENVANVVITGNDLMQYSTKEIKVKAGQKVRLTLRHIGKLDIKVMGHNVVILKQGVDLAGFAAKAASAIDNHYIPKDSDDIIVHTDLVGGGQTTTIEFDAPDVGTYQFLCSFPGHFAMMQGNFIVE